MEAAEIPAYDGWYALRIDEGESLHELRVRLVVGGADSGEIVTEEDDSDSVSGLQQGREFPARQTAPRASSSASPQGTA